MLYQRFIYNIYLYVFLSVLYNFEIYVISLKYLIIFLSLISVSFFFSGILLIHGRNKLVIQWLTYNMEILLTPSFLHKRGSFWTPMHNLAMTLRSSMYLYCDVIKYRLKNIFIKKNLKKNVFMYMFCLNSFL